MLIASLVASTSGGPLVKILTYPVVVWIGRISYSLYLWHWVVIISLRWTVGMESRAAQVVAMLLTLLLSALSYYLVEIPFQRRNSSLQKRRVLALAGGLGVVFVSYLAFRAVVSERVQNIVGLSVVTRNRADWRPTFSEGHVGSGRKQWSDRRIFFVGDSHAGAYASMLQQLQLLDGVEGYLYTVPGGRIGSLVYPAAEDTDARTASILTQLTLTSRTGDVVVLANLRVKRLCEQWGEIDQAQREEAVELNTEPNRRLAVQQGLILIRKLQKLGLTVIVEAPLPVFPSPPFRVSDWFNKMNPVGRAGFTISRGDIDERRASAMKSLREVQAVLPNVIVWDPLPVLCTGNICFAFDGEKPLFFDGDHLSAYGGRKLYSSFRTTLEQLWEKPGILP